MKDINKIEYIYFLGAGGIGMSALVRYFIHLNKFVAGYDLTPTELTDNLIFEGADLHFTDMVDAIPQEFRNKEKTIVVYTPAVPKTNNEYVYFQENGFTMLKRSEVLGLITNSTKALCVAGTHGKTTTSTMLAHLMYGSHLECNAFLGGISKNYHTNLLLSKTSEYTVIEADEYDRSFHRLTPYMSIITSTDPDHLDIYHTVEAYEESFEHYTSLIKEGGALVIKRGVSIKPKVGEGVRIYDYSINEGDFHAENIQIGGGKIIFDFVTPKGVFKGFDLGVPVLVNLENAIAAMALAFLNGLTEEELRKGIKTFQGVGRRFDFKIRNAEHALLSDYGHHPEEVKRSIGSLRELYPNKKLTVIFQPHLFSRTKDFYREFAESLSLADEVILTDIYPARELPMEGVSSKLIYDCLKNNVIKYICRKEDLLQLISDSSKEIVMILGAGDIDNYTPKLYELLKDEFGD